MSLISLMTLITHVIHPAHDVLAMDNNPVVELSTASMIQPMSATSEIVDTTSNQKKNDSK